MRDDMTKNVHFYKFPEQLVRREKEKEKKKTFFLFSGDYVRLLID